MSDSTPSDGLFDRVAHILKLVGAMADAIRATEPSLTAESAARVATTWRALLPAIIAAGNSLPPDSNQLSDWIREVGRVSKWFHEMVQQHGISDVLFRFNCDGFVRVAEAGTRLLERPYAVQDPFSFVDPAVIVKALEIDTTPVMPKPPKSLVEASMRAIPLILADVKPNHTGAIELIASYLAKRLQNAGHTLAAAQWAIHESILAGQLQPAVVEEQLPGVVRVVGGPMSQSSGSNDRRTEWLGFGKATRPILKGKPTPFDNFKVVATESLWVSWQEASTAPPMQSENSDIVAQNSAEEDEQNQPATRIWSNPVIHTVGKFWTRKDGVIGLSTKTNLVPDGTVEFAAKPGTLTFQMRFMLVMCSKFPNKITLAEVIVQVYGNNHAPLPRDPVALAHLLRKLRSLVSDIRKKLRRAGMNPEILPRLSVDTNAATGIQLNLAHLHRLDDSDLDEADKA